MDRLPLWETAQEQMLGETWGRSDGFVALDTHDAWVTMGRLL